MSILDGLEQIEEVKPEQILQSLIQKDNSIRLKTHIVAPTDISVLRMLQETLRNYKMEKTAETINVFLNYYEEYMVSFNRESRREVITALSNVLAQQKEETAIKKFLGAKE